MNDAELAAIDEHLKQWTYTAPEAMPTTAKHLAALIDEVRRLKCTIANLHSECHAHADQHAGEERENAKLRALAEELGEALHGAMKFSRIDMHDTPDVVGRWHAALAKLAEMKRSWEQPYGG